MNSFRYIFRSLSYYWKAHLSYLFICLLFSCVLAGAFGAGKQLKKRLKLAMDGKLGRTDSILISNKFFFFADSVKDMPGHNLVPILYTNGTASSAIDGKSYRADVRLIGITDKFGGFLDRLSFHDNSGALIAFVNTALAQKLKLKDGDEILTRLYRNDMPPLDTPFISQDKLFTVIRMKTRIIPEMPGSMADFSMDISSSMPLNIFLPLDCLSEKAGIPGRANILLIKGKTPDMDADIFSKFGIGDLQLSLKPTPDSRYLELKSDNVFIEKEIADTALSYSKKPFRIFSYFVNSIDSKDFTTPYSFVCGTDLPFLPGSLKDDEIIVNEWLANDLKIQPGDSLSIRYFALDLSGKLEEKSSVFKVSALVPMKAPYIGKDLSPGLKMLEGVENCKDWDSSLPVNIVKIRDQDEKYWDDFKSAPKAFIGIDKACEIWKNRFGTLTALRYPVVSDGNSMPESEEIKSLSLSLSSDLMKKLEPGKLGFELLEIRRKMLGSVDSSTDFSAIFAGMSFFIIASVLGMIYLVTSVSIEKRIMETGILLSLGFKSSSIKKLFLLEILVPSTVGIAAGILLSPFYETVMLFFIKRFLTFQHSTSLFEYDLDISTALTAFCASLIPIVLTVLIALHLNVRTSPAGLLKEAAGATNPGRKILASIIMISVCLLFCSTIIFRGSPETGKNAAAAFFGAAFLFLISAFLIFRLAVIYFSGKSFSKMNMGLLAIKNCLRGKNRSISVIFSLAVAVFMLASVGANRFDPAKGENERSSGSGGFQFFAKSTLPILGDLNGDRERKKYGIDGVEFDQVRFVQLKSGRGDEANCLNLNRVSAPRLLGVNPAEFDERKAFSFVKCEFPYGGSDSPWPALDEKDRSGCVPGFIDNNVLMWGIGKKIGDVIEYRGENGKPLKVRISAALSDSVFQGNILIADKFIKEYFPSVQGTNVFLVECPEKIKKQLRERLEYGMEDAGLELLPAGSLLAKFAEVENAYLDIFMLLGAFGLLIGTAGLGIVTVKNIIDRKRENAVLRAIGFAREDIYKILMIEHSGLFCAGLLLGLLSASIALIPSVSARSGKVPFLEIGLIFSAIIISGFLCIRLAIGFLESETVSEDLHKE